MYLALSSSVFFSLSCQEPFFSSFSSFSFPLRASLFFLRFSVRWVLQVSDFWFSVSEEGAVARSSFTLRIFFLLGTFKAIIAFSDGPPRVRAAVGKFRGYQSELSFSKAVLSFVFSSAAFSSPRFPEPIFFSATLSFPPRVWSGAYTSADIFQTFLVSFRFFHQVTIPAAATVRG